MTSYNLKLGQFWQFKTELYVQNLSQAPVSATSENSYSLLNEMDGFADGALVNAGRGRNYGLEISLEHPLATGFYLLFSTSLYQSKYQDRRNMAQYTLQWQPTDQLCLWQGMGLEQKKPTKKRCAEPQSHLFRRVA